MPDQQLPFAAGFDQGRRAVAGLAGRERAPSLLAGFLVEGDDDAAFAAHQADELVAVHERMAAEAPHRGFDLVVLLQIARPEDGPFLDIEAVEVAHAAEGVDLAAVHRGGAAGAAGVGDGVLAGILPFPQRLAVGRAIAQHALIAAEFAPGEAGGDLVLGVEVDDKHPPIGDRRPRVAIVDRNAPFHFRPVLGKFLEDPGLPPDAVAARPEPLRPIIGTDAGHAGHPEHHQRDSAAD